MRCTGLVIGMPIFLLMVMPGCSQPPMGRWEPALDAMARNAAVRDQTLYDQHFTPTGAALTRAGRERLLHIVRYSHADVPYVLVAQNWDNPGVADGRVAAVQAELAGMNGGIRALAVRSADVPVWGMSGEEATTSVEGMLKAYAQSRGGSQSSTTGIVISAAPSGAGQ